MLFVFCAIMRKNVCRVKAMIWFHARTALLHRTAPHRTQAIFNNRTAMVVYQRPPSVAHTQVSAKTGGSGVQAAAFDAWDLAPI
jgi:hypothetical protein